MRAHTVHIKAPLSNNPEKASVGVINDLLQASETVWLWAMDNFSDHTV